MEGSGRTMEKRLVIGILAHVDAGKTTLSEEILFETGVIRQPGRVDRQDAFLDNYELERARGITIFSKQAVFKLGDKQVTLLDTPGHVDFSPEMERTLQVLDYAILVVSGADGVQGHTETLWRLLGRYRVPVFVFVNKMDQDGTDREMLMEELKKRLHDNCVDFGLERAQRDENLAMCEEQALDAFLDKGSLEDSQVAGMIRLRKAFPCYFGSALKQSGVKELLEGLARYGEGPSYGKTFAARVFKITRDEQGNRLTHMKITGGSLKVKEELVFSEGGPGEKINQIRVYCGARYEAVLEAEAGVVCAVMGPGGTLPGQALGAESILKAPFLEPVLTYQMILPQDCNVHEMLKNMRQLEEEEPELHVAWNEAHREIQVQVMGQVQIEILKCVISQRFGVDVEFGPGNIVYKETITRTVEGVGHFEPLRHYAEVHLLMEPGERGSGLIFDTRCSQDVLDGSWQRLILTHLEEKRHPGVLTGAQLTDMKITLIAGRAHLKHTEGGDFRQATYRAVRQGLMEGDSRLLEPFFAFRLEIPSEYTGRALADIDRMQGRFEPPVVEGDRTIICGNAPVALMRDYQMEVAAYTRGRGQFSCRLSGYEPCGNEDEVVAASGYDPEGDVDNPTGFVFCTHGAGFQVPWYQVKEYMHVESPVELQVRHDSGENQKAQAGSRSGAGGFYVDDKELEEIFTRTYGISKREKYRDQGPRKVTYQEIGGVRSGKLETPKEEHLLVDGYNIMFAWEELRELAKTTVDGARHKLMDILCNYQGYRKCVLILVFDAYKVEGGIGQAIRYNNIHVVYTKEAETADQYIEKLAYKLGRDYQVTVATSDGLEQLIIRGEGCRLLSAQDLREEIAYVERQIETEHLEPLRQGTGKGKNYLLGHAGEDVAKYLEAVRLGKGTEKKGKRGGENGGRKADKK